MPIAPRLSETLTYAIRMSIITVSSLYHITHKYLISFASSSICEFILLFEMLTMSTKNIWGNSSLFRGSRIKKMYATLQVFWSIFLGVANVLNKWIYFLFFGAEYKNNFPYTSIYIYICIKIFRISSNPEERAIWC